MQQQTETTFEEKKNKFYCLWHFVRDSVVGAPTRTNKLCTRRHDMPPSLSSPVGAQGTRAPPSRAT